MIVRIKRSTKFSVINNTVLEDRRLSWRARGIAAYLLTKPDDWEINHVELWKSGIDGRDAVLAGMKELEECGYLVRTRTQNAEGKYSTSVTLYEEPQDEEPQTPPTPGNPTDYGKPEVGKPGVGKPAVGFPGVLLNTEIPSTEHQTTTDSVTNVTAQAPPVASLVEQFRLLREELQKPKSNRADILRRAYVLCHGEVDCPSHGRVGQFAKVVGGAGYALDLLFSCVARPPNGNVLDYLEAAHKARQNERRKPYSKKPDAPTEQVKYSEWNT